jgi:DNA-binding CsgD family transcriptional regulator
MSTLPEDAKLSRIAGDIYDAALEPALWSVALAGARDFVGGSTAGIVVKDVVDNRGSVCFDDGSIDPDYTASYFERYVALDPCTTGHFFSSVDQPVSTGDLMPEDSFRETRFYKEWARPQGFVDYIATALDRSATAAIVFNVMRRSGDGMFDDAARRRMRLAARHVRRAMLIGKSIDLRSAQAASLADALDGLSAGMFLIAASGRIVHANAAGRAILAETDLLYALGGRLTARDPEARRAIAASLAVAADANADLGAVRAGIPLVAGSGERYVARMLSLTSGNRRGAQVAYGAVAAVFVHKTTLNLPSPVETVARHFRLTPMELRVLLGIVEVGGIPEVASALGLGDATVKTHLGNLYGKTGVSRQADLVKLVAGYASPIIN